MNIEKKILDEQHYLYVDRECAFEPQSISEAMGSGFGEVFGFAGQHAITPRSMPMSLYVEMPSDKLRFRAGMLVSAEDAARSEGDVKAGLIPAGEALTATHVGPYSSLSQSHRALWDYADAEGLIKAFPVWEIFVDDPQETKEDELRTEIFRFLGGPCEADA